MIQLSKSQLQQENTLIYNAYYIHQPVESLRIPLDKCSCNQGMIHFISYFKIAVFHNLCKVWFSWWKACCVWWVFHMCIENKNFQLFTCHYFFSVHDFPSLRFTDVYVTYVTFLPFPEFSYMCTLLHQSIHVQL